MRADHRRGVCPLCGDPNSYSTTHCRRCGFALPWARAEEAAPSLTTDESKSSALADDGFDFFPDEKRNCRYCNAPLQVSARQCPQCKMWLDSFPALFEIAPHDFDYDKDATRRVDMIQPTGCLAGGPRLIFLIVITGFYFFL